MRLVVFSLSFSCGPPARCSSNARQRKVCVRFAQSFDGSARQLLVTGEQILASHGSRKLMRKLSHHVPMRYLMSRLTSSNTLLWATLLWVATFLSFSLLSSCTFSWKVHRRKRHSLLLTCKFYLVETQSSNMNRIGSERPSERAKRSIVETNMLEKIFVKNRVS